MHSSDQMEDCFISGNSTTTPNQIAEESIVPRGARPKIIKSKTKMCASKATMTDLTMADLTFISNELTGQNLDEVGRNMDMDMSGQGNEVSNLQNMKTEKDEERNETIQNCQTSSLVPVFNPFVALPPPPYQQMKNQSCHQVEEIHYPQIDDEYIHYVENTRTGQKFPTRGFQNGNQGRTLTLTEKFQLSSEKSLGRREGLARPPPAASQFKEGQCSCCRQAHLIPDCPKFKKLSNQKQSKIIRRDHLCYHCLEGPHLIKDCKINEGNLCGKDGCELYHHRVLHRNP
jgi:hypothetical protein